jgi:hypothetical protein
MRAADAAIAGARSHVDALLRVPLSRAWNEA